MMTTTQLAASKAGDVQLTEGAFNGAQLDLIPIGNADTD
jgi:hypothetical protein